MSERELINRLVTVLNETLEFYVDDSSGYLLGEKEVLKEAGAALQEGNEYLSREKRGRR